ncbi:MAG: mechanosensitive ion channel protein MscS [Candidatus Marinimicrobia bacterium]|nr:mechanosensitive ion channel protein MscS [Candidatus Neomarinimicrobiota bacterium]|tara:strand:- start:17370 stop:18269 length:900 start_codon:yes stop_codon:yes gene_type:complete
MLDNLDWFTRFFTYSSIQVKFIASFIAMLSFIILRKLFLKILFRNTSNALVRYRWQKISSYVINVLALIIIGQIWFKGFESVATYLGLLSAGIAIALKDPLINLTGWAFILSRAPFVVGDRVQIGEHSGDVIDINFFKFTLMEVGHWGEGEQASGRIIHIPNGKVFIDILANYSKGFKYIWNEVDVLLTFESDWKKAKKTLEKISKKHTANISKVAAKNFKQVSRLYMVYQPDFEPQVYTKVEDSGILLTIRYLCNPRKRRITSQFIWEDILDEFDKDINLEFAYPTTRFFDAKSENKS